MIESRTSYGSNSNPPPSSAHKLLVRSLGRGTAITHESGYAPHSAEFIPREP